MTLFPIPEILRTPLESLVVQAKIHSPNCKVVKKTVIIACYCCLYVTCKRWLLCVREGRGLHCTSAGQSRA